MAYVLVTGNPFDGLMLHGPFPDVDSAIEYGENHYASDSFEAVLLNPADLDAPGECGSCGAMIGPSADYLWHAKDEDCRAARQPIEANHQISK